MMKTTIFAMAALTVIGHVQCFAQATPSATPDLPSRINALKMPVCVDVEAPETVKNTITNVLVGVLRKEDDVEITDDQASAYVVFHVEVAEAGSIGYAGSIVASSHDVIDTLLNNISDADSEKEFRKDYKDTETLEWNNLYVASSLEDLCKQFVSDIEFNSLADMREGKKKLEDIARRPGHK